VKELTTINSSVAYIHKLDTIKLTTGKHSMQEFMQEQSDEIKVHNATLASQMEAIKAACNIIEFTIKN
jgi:phospholipase/lecithinase/hemolysin